MNEDIVEKKSLLPIIAALVAPMTFAQGTGAINTVLTFLSNIFQSLFNPSITGLAIFLKFTIIVITFAIAYEKLPGGWNKGPRAIISLALGLGAGLAIPTELALTTGAFYGSLIVAVLIMLPFILMGIATYYGIKHAETNWVYPGLILGWLVYFILLAYFLAHVGTLPTVFGWVFTVGTILLTLSPLIILVLLGVLIAGGEEEQRSSFSDLMKKWSKHDIKGKAKTALEHFAQARTNIRGARRSKHEDDKRARIRNAMREIRHANTSARAIQAKASQMMAESAIPGGHRDTVDAAIGLVGQIAGMLRDLQPLTEATPAQIDTMLDNLDIIGHLEDLIDQVTIVSHLAQKVDRVASARPRLAP